MARIVVIGAGVGGLTAAMLLARDGHDVTVLERDPAPSPESADDAWFNWERRSIAQFRQVHYFAPRFRALMDENLPEMRKEFMDLGALELNPMDLIPPEVTGGERETDAFDFTSVTARRPVAETAVARAAAKTKGVEIRRGVVVTELLTGASAGDGVPHVTGVRTESGDDIAADLVVDATGRRSGLPKLLAGIGARAPEEELEDSGLTYYGRHFRTPDGAVPVMMAGLLTPFGTVSTLTLPADNGTVGLGIIASAHDKELRKLLDVDTWMRTWRSYPLVAHWADGEPVDGNKVGTIAKIEDRYRRFVVEGEPCATGLVAVADSWACTNPSLGRGVSIGFIHTCALRDTMRATSLDDPVEFALAFDNATMETVEPWYRATLAFDRHRLAEIDSLIAGEPYEPGDPEWEITNAMAHAAMQDPDVFRAFLRIAGVVELPQQSLARPGVFDKIVSLGEGWRDAEVPAPTRAELLEIVGG
jgi:2-polyprenyl-6-methoxyphenol hydroxylase-like FAD-dependent oxidoreductase